jgi:hypothetical protein
MHFGFFRFPAGLLGVLGALGGSAFGFLFPAQ